MRKFVALYTHQKLKKAKTWQDGFAHYNETANEIVLFDANNGRIASHRMRAKEALGLAVEYDVGRFLLTLEEEQGVEVQVSEPAAKEVAPVRLIRRTKRLPSLIKPMKLKQKTPASVVTDTSEPVDSQPTVVELPATQTTAEVNSVEYVVLYTTQKTKKVKAWSDGELAVSADDHQITLKSDDGSTVLKTRIPAKTEVHVGSELDCGKYLIQIESVKGQDAVPIVDSTAPNGLQLQGALKRRHEPTARLALKQNRPKLAKSGSSTVSPHGSVTVAPKRAQFVPPTAHVIKHLHFPRRGELLQHVNVSKGYGLGPARKLVAPVRYTEWTLYASQFGDLLRENLMAELSALAMRYYFMARERFEARSKKRTGFAQVCKSVGVLLFEGCTLRQAFLDSGAFRAQRNRGAIELHQGDSVMLELSRREAYAGYAKDDTWAISTRDDFPADETFLARSVFYGPNKNNVLELALVGDEDAKAAAHVFNGAGSSRGEKTAATVFAIHCLDSASSWSMLDTVEQLSPKSLPYLPHLLDTSAPQPANVNSAIDVASVVDRINGIVSEYRLQLSLNDEQHVILQDVVHSVASIYLPLENAESTVIVHGPFGTGKSFLVAAIAMCLDEMAYEFPEVFGSARERDSDVEIIGGVEIIGDVEVDDEAPPPLKLLLSSMTNFAVDNMLSALVKQGYERFLRVGSLRRVAKSILPYVYRSSASAADDIRELETMLKTADPAEQDSITVALQKMRQQGQQGALTDTFVVGTTCLSAAAATLRSTQFPVVVLDEACQIVEPMALIALANGGCRRLVLVGDPQQLPPTLTTRATRDAEGCGLDRGLFDRLVQMGHRPRRLTTQYRCHPRIGALCSRLFYNNSLAHGTNATARAPLVPGLPPLAFLDTPGREQQHGASQSFFNRGEIDVVVQLTCHLLRAGISPESLGVIALYKTQADMLREQLRTASDARVQVSTVDAYQGSERDIIIISCVRSEKIGFIANPNRVNVALSRARHHCLVVGSRKLLQTNGMWKCVIEECKGERLGVGDAQVLVNHVASVAAQSVQCGGVDGLAEVVDIDHLSDDDLAEDDLDKDNLFKVHLSEDELDKDNLFKVHLSEDELDKEELDNHGLDRDNLSDDDLTESLNTELHGQEGVVGGLLSQWSQWSPGEFSSSYPDNDILGCLDVDLDEM